MEIANFCAAMDTLIDQDEVIWDPKIQDILLSFCAYNYTHIRQSIQEHNIHKYTIQTQKLQILYKLNCFAVPDKHIQKHM